MKIYSNDPKAAIISAVEQAFTLMAPTYGPHGKGVLIDRDWAQELVDDGYTILSELELEDELENSIVKFIREASKKTNSRAGDGTTTSFMILTAILRAVYGPNSKFIVESQRRGVAKELREAVKDVVKQIRESAKAIETEEDLYNIAKSSYDNEEIARLIAKTYIELGKTGVVTVESSESMETTAKTVPGMLLDKGYISPNFAMKAVNGVVELKKPLILICDSFISSVKQIEAVLDMSFRNKDGVRDLLIIAEDFAGEALATLIVGVLRGSINACVIKVPGFGDNKKNYLKDIAMLTGGEVVSDELGKPLSSLKIEDLGSADKVTITKDETIISNGHGNKEKVESHAATILTSTKVDGPFDKKRMDERIARLTGGIGVVFVGAPTENEMKTVKAKVEDAVNATGLAFREGVVLGGGQTLVNATTTCEVLQEALRFPREQLIANGKDITLPEVIDPAGVVVAALESAVSVGASLIDCAGIIVPKNKKEDKE